MSPRSGWKKLVSTGSVTWSPSLNGLRNKLTKGLEVRVDAPRARRGDEVHAVIVISDVGHLGDLEAGLVCTEYYDEETASSSSDHGTSRTTSNAIEHEEWQRLPSIEGEHSVRFTIPPHAPFTYDGSCLSFKWEVVARGRKSRRLDARVSTTIAVSP